MPGGIGGDIRRVNGGGGMGRYPKGDIRADRRHDIQDRSGFYSRQPKKGLRNLRASSLSELQGGGGDAGDPRESEASDPPFLYICPPSRPRSYVGWPDGIEILKNELAKSFSYSLHIMTPRVCPVHILRPPTNSSCNCQVHLDPFDSTWIHLSLLGSICVHLDTQIGRSGLKC